MNAALEVRLMSSDPGPLAAEEIANLRPLAGTSRPRWRFPRDVSRLLAAAEVTLRNPSLRHFRAVARRSGGVRWRSSSNAKTPPPSVRFLALKAGDSRCA